MSQVHHPVTLDVVVAVFRHALDHQHEGLTPEQHFVQVLLEALGEAPPMHRDHDDHPLVR